MNQSPAVMCLIGLLTCDSYHSIAELPSNHISKCYATSMRRHSDFRLSVVDHILSRLGASAAVLTCPFDSFSSSEWNVPQQPEGGPAWHRLQGPRLPTHRDGSGHEWRNGKHGDDASCRRSPAPSAVVYGFFFSSTATDANSPD